MKEKIKDVLGTIIFIVIVIFIILWYPWFASVKDGKTTCHNIFGVTMNCR